MALSKKITDNRGIVANYHKIYSVINNGGDLTVEVHGYASEDYRNKENNAKKLFERQFEIGLKLSELSAIPVEKRSKEDTETIEKLFAESESLSINASDTDCAICKATYTLRATEGEEISFKQIYNKLKALDAFKGAKDI